MLCGELDWPRESVLDPQDDLSGEVWVAWDSGKPVATARLSVKDGLASLEALAVLPAYRRRGLGREFSRLLAERARAQGHGQLLALAPAAPAAFFQSLKFEARETRQTWTLWSLSLL